MNATPDFYNDLDSTLSKTWESLERGAQLNSSGFHIAQLATITPDGRPTIRSVVLRSVERHLKILIIHTDMRSRKIEELSRQPDVSMHFYDPTRKIQLRCACTASLEQSKQKRDGVWQKMPPINKLCYRQPIAPNAELDTLTMLQELEVLSDADGFANLGVVRLHVTAIEWLYLAAEGHRRAIFHFERNGTIAKTWLAP